MADPRKMLIIRLSSLGDIIHTLPAFESLRRTFPDSRIHWMVERRLAFLLSAVEGIDEVIAIDTHAMRQNSMDRIAWRRLWTPISAVRAHRYDLVIDFQGLIKTAVLSFLTGAGRRVGFSKSLVRERPAHWFYHDRLEKPAPAMHVAQLNLLLAERAGGHPGQLRAHLNANGNDIRAIEARLLEEQLCEYVVINPGGGWPTKQWSATRYGSLAARIATELHLRVVVTTGPGEEDLYQQIAESCAAMKPLHLQVPFLQLIPLFKRARLVVAGDTGPLHLACALGAPVVGILGPTSPVRNGPWSQDDETVVRRLPCSFCNKRKCPTANECLDIPVEDVFAAVQRRLAGTRSS